MDTPRVATGVKWVIAALANRITNTKRSSLPILSYRVLVPGANDRHDEYPRIAANRNDHVTHSKGVPGVGIGDRP